MYNVEIGEGIVIVGCIGIVGSICIGKYCIIVGVVGIVGYFEIVDCVYFIMWSVIIKSIIELGLYLLGIVMFKIGVWCKNVVWFW